jgi:hypothetical protein
MAAREELRQAVRQLFGLMAILAGAFACVLGIVWFFSLNQPADAAGPQRKTISYQSDAYGNCYAIVSGGGQWVVAVPHCP